MAYEHKGTDYGGYRLLSNNCAHYVEELLSAGQNDNDIVNDFHDKRITIPAVLHVGTKIAEKIGEAVEKINSWKSKIKLRF